MKHCIHIAVASLLLAGCAESNVAGLSARCSELTATRSASAANFANAAVSASRSVVTLPLIPAAVSSDGTVAGSDAQGPLIWRNGVVTRVPGIERLSGAANGYAIGMAGSSAFLIDPQHVATNIGSLAGGSGATQALGINANALVVGSSISHAFFWTPCDGMLPLPDTSSAPDTPADTSTGTPTLSDLIADQSATSAAEDINLRGDAAGFIQTSASSHEQRATVWHTRNGARVVIGLLHGTDRSSIANAVNDDGLVVGFSGIRSGPGTVEHGRAFAWRAGIMTEIGTFGGDYSEAFDVNIRGEVVGVASDATGQRFAFLWTADGGLQKLDTQGAASSSAVAISDAGDVVGKAGTHGAAWITADNRAAWSSLFTP